MDEKVAIVNELDQWFSSCLEAAESSYSGRFWVVPPLTELLGVWTRQDDGGLHDKHVLGTRFSVRTLQRLLAEVVGFVGSYGIC